MLQGLDQWSFLRSHCERGTCGNVSPLQQVCGTRKEFVSLMLHRDATRWTHCADVNGNIFGGDPAKVHVVIHADIML